MRDGERRGSTEAGQRGNQDVKAALGKAKVGLGYLADATKTVGVEIMTAYNEAGDWRGGAGGRPLAAQQREAMQGAIRRLEAAKGKPGSM